MVEVKMDENDLGANGLDEHMIVRDTEKALKMVQCTMHCNVRVKMEMSEGGMVTDSDSVRGKHG